MCIRDSHKILVPNRADCYVSPSALKKLMLQWLKGTAAETVKTPESPSPSELSRAITTEQEQTTGKKSKGLAGEEDYYGLDFKKVVKHIMHYGFVEIADDILFAMLVGIALGGLLFIVIPSELMSNEYARWLAYPVMILVGVPLYICASASTPIAAALVARGFSPGAALIFLMTGPATNTSTIAIIMSQFGTRFATIYVMSVIVVTAIFGITIDLILLATSLTISVNLLPPESATLQILQWGGAIALLGLFIWRYRAGAMRKGYKELVSNVGPLKRLWGRIWRHLARRQPSQENL